MNKLLANSLFSLGLISVSGLPAMAQNAAPAAKPGTPAHTMRHTHEPRAFSKPSERVEARLAYIKTALKITDAQQTQWNAYADTLRKQAAARDKQFQERNAQRAKQGERQRPSAVESLERRQRFLTEEAARLNEQLTSQKPLYAALSPEQKQIADRVLTSRGGRGGFGGHHRHGRHGMA